MDDCDEDIKVIMKVYNHVDTLRLRNEIKRIDMAREKMIA